MNPGHILDAACCTSSEAAIHLMERFSPKQYRDSMKIVQMPALQDITIWKGAIETLTIKTS